MDNTDAGGWLWLMIDVLMVAVLAAAVIYGTLAWRRKRRDPALEAASERATRELYERAARDEHEEEQKARDRAA